MSITSYIYTCISPHTYIHVYPLTLTGNLSISSYLAMSVTKLTLSVTKLTMSLKSSSVELVSYFHMLTLNKT